MRSPVPGSDATGLSQGMLPITIGQSVASDPHATSSSDRHGSDPVAWARRSCATLIPAFDMHARSDDLLDTLRGAVVRAGCGLPSKRAADGDQLAPSTCCCLRVGARERFTEPAGMSCRRSVACAYPSRFAAGRTQRLLANWPVRMGHLGGLRVLRPPGSSIWRATSAELHPGTPGPRRGAWRFGEQPATAIQA